MRPGIVIGAARAGRRGIARVASHAWPEHSCLFLVGDRVAWSVARDVEELEKIARRVGVRTGPPQLAVDVRRQCVFYVSQFNLFGGRGVPSENRLAVAYYHGRPGTEGMPEFDACFAGLRQHHERLARVQVTHGEMRDVVLSSGIDPAKVFLIPIGVDAGLFLPTSAASTRAARERWGIPHDAVAVGSIQKDGVGWGDGREPKLIKGPDVFVDSIERLRKVVPELFVVLAGPSRGYVVSRLEELGVPYIHHVPDGLADIADLYHALDLYLITSRQEGGPKAVLEAMATGVPLVTTRVGQATELVSHGENGWIVDVDDVDGLVHWAEHALTGHSETAAVVRAARQTAVANSYKAQTPLWDAFFAGFVSRS